MNKHPQVIKKRSDKEISNAIKRRIHGYTPRWNPQPTSVDNTILDIYSKYIETLTSGINRVRLIKYPRKIRAIIGISAEKKVIILKCLNQFNDTVKKHSRY